MLGGSTGHSRELRYSTPKPVRKQVKASGGGVGGTCRQALVPAQALATTCVQGDGLAQQDVPPQAGCVPLGAPQITHFIASPMKQAPSVQQVYQPGNLH